MIKIKITADTVVDLRKELIALIAGDPAVALAVEINKEVAATAQEISPEPIEPAPAPAEQPKTRTRAPKEKAAESVTMAETATLQEREPLMRVVETSDPLAQLSVATSSDPLAGGTPTPAAAEPGVLTLEMIRHKVAKAALNNNKQAVKDLIKTYLTAEGKPCEITTEIPEKDWADYYAKLDLIGL